MEEPLYFLVTPSQRWFVRPDGRLDHRERSQRISLGALDLHEDAAIVHFFLWDEGANAGYGELGSRGRLPAMDRFLDRGLRTFASRRIAVPPGVISTFPETLPLLQGRGFTVETPVGAFRPAMKALQAWERETMWKLDAEVMIDELAELREAQ